MRGVDLRVVLLGVGAVGRDVLQLLAKKGPLLRERYGIHPLLVAALDSSGGLLNAAGLPLEEIRAHKERGGRIVELPAAVAGLTVPMALAQVQADLLIDASPVNLTTGEPGMSAVQAALRQGLDVVLANKAPLVLAYRTLQALAARRGARLAFSATVCGGLPVLNVGQRDLIAARVKRFRGILNSTTNYLLEQMEQGESFAVALEEAQRRGIAEADPRLDIEGWDTANKLVIVANAVLGMEATLQDIERVEGITHIGPDDVRRAREQGNVIKLVGEALLRENGRYTLRVLPRPLREDSFLAQVRGWEMGVVFETDIYEMISAKIDERGPMATAAAVLRDVVNLATTRAR